MIAFPVHRRKGDHIIPDGTPMSDLYQVSFPGTILPSKTNKHAVNEIKVKKNFLRKTKYTLKR